MWCFVYVLYLIWRIIILQLLLIFIHYVVLLQLILIRYVFCSFKIIMPFDRDLWWPDGVWRVLGFSSLLNINKPARHSPHVPGIFSKSSFIDKRCKSPDDNIHTRHSYLYCIISRNNDYDIDFAALHSATVTYL